MNIQGEERSSSWQRVQELGQGGFGNVCLYRNTTTNEHIAIKKLQLREEFGDIVNRVWERWKQEVYIMDKLDHPSVIRAIAVPPELRNGPDEFPALGMEYCEGGDLRRLLTRPENCNGLREVFVRDLLSGVGSAIEYLHNKRIIHRDLKPENIVLQPTGEEDRYLYKIIDLGYAKELDASSSCMLSHVGTQQYLAPELYGKQAYTRTVDYWSFGSVVFECITGKRPFLPDHTSVQWHKEVSKKSPDDITAFQDERGEVKFSKRLPGPTHLCGPLKNYLEQWLKLMLRWDSKSRGGGIKKFADGVERPKCFCVVEEIIDMKLFHVRFAKANHLLTFPVHDRHVIDAVHLAIQAQTRIPVAQQLLISKSGVTLRVDQLAIQACQDSSYENPSVFLFCLGPVPGDVIVHNDLPLRVQQIIKEPHTVLPQQTHKQAWKNAVYFCAIENFDYKQLVNSQLAAMNALLHRGTIVAKQKADINNEMTKLLAFQEYFKKSLEIDLQQYDTHDSMVEAMAGVYNGWIESKQEAESINNLVQEVFKLCSVVEEMMPRIMELQKKPTALTKDANKLEECEKEAKRLYDKLRSRRMGQETLEHGPMVDIIGNCMYHRKELTKHAHDSIDDIMDVYQRLGKVLPEMEAMNNTIQSKKQRLFTMQRKRQEAVWTFSTETQQSSSTPNFNMSGSVSFSSLWNGNASSSMMSLSNNMESIRLVDDCKTSVQHVDDVLEAMEKEHEENMRYFSTVID